MSGNNSVGPELVLGLVGAVGTDLTAAVDAITQEFCSVNYVCREVRLSRQISLIPWALRENPEKLTENKRIDCLMDAGNEIRRKLKRGDAVARLGILEIMEARKNSDSKNGKPLERVCYILNSLKHPDEVDMLRRIYGNNFISVSVYSPREKRLKNLASKIAKSHRQFDVKKFNNAAEYLIEKDAEESGNELGQNVRKTFPKSDVFVKEGDKLRSQICRFTQILFGHPYITPTRDEFGMFHAWATSLRSADLSRQVGAVVASREGDILSSGCNEVPRAGGGTFWQTEGSTDIDDRDFQHGRDASAIMKLEIVKEIFLKLQEKGFLDQVSSEKSSDTLAQTALYNGDFPLLKGAQVSEILEFGRIVHAEMACITDAARRGVKIQDSILYCTTFPCHMCARHIIASGVSRVVYIEPYPKSKAKQLYEKSICVEEDSIASLGAVKFEPFVGISPVMYSTLFKMAQRKDKFGYTIKWSSEQAQPKTITQEYPRYLDSEKGAVNELYDSGVLEGNTNA